MIYISDITTEAPTDKRGELETKVYKLLAKNKIPFERVDNDVVETMEECIEVDKALGTEIRKSIFLCNQKKTSFFLVVMPANKPLDTAAFGKKIGISHLSFASGELMEQHLGCSPGSAGVMGLISDEDDYVQCIVDKEVADEEWFGCNVGINTTHIKIKTNDLLKKFLPSIRHKAKIMEL